MTLSIISRVLREPLLHFIVITGLFFLVYGLMNPVTDDAVIEVGEARIQQMKNQFYRKWQRQPTPGELNGLIDNLVLDEIYVREARALGLEENDEIIRRRLRQKMEFLYSDAAVFNEPDDDVLEAFMHDNAERFKIPDRYSFHQVFVSVDRPPEVIQEVLREQQEKMARGDMPEGDNSLLAMHFEQVPAFELERTFGQGFAGQLDAAPQGQWSGPLRSDLGLHFVYLDAREAGELPALMTVRDKVLVEWQYRQQQASKREYEAGLRQRYRVEIGAGQ